MRARVVSLGARAELARMGERSYSVDVHEFAVLDDGRRLILHQDRGYSGSGQPSRAHEEHNVLTTVLGDDAEITGEDHPWEWLASLIQDHGVTVTSGHLEAVPYVIEFGPRLAALLMPPGPR